MKNKYEKLFDDFMTTTEFSLIKYGNKWGIEDQLITSGIDEERFSNAREIFDRMQCYIDDYIFRQLEETYRDLQPTFEMPTDSETWLKIRDRLKDWNCDLELDWLDMIDNHYNEIDLNNCDYQIR